jgi:putative membrane protein
MRMSQDVGQPKGSGELFRLRLQLEQTLLVWVRTSLALMGFGFVIARFGVFLREVTQVADMRVHQNRWLGAVSTYGGTALIVLGVAVLLLAVAGHRRMVDQLEQGNLTLPPRWSLAVILGLVLAALGMSLAVYLASVDL